MAHPDFLENCEMVEAIIKDVERHCTPTQAQIEAAAKAICRVQHNGADPCEPAIRWNGTEMEPQEFPAWHDFMDEARHALIAAAEVTLTCR